MFIGISISYSHQNLMLLVLVLACIGSLTTATQRMSVQAKRRAGVPAAADEPRMRALPA